MRRFALVPMLLSALALLEPRVAGTQQPQGQATPQVSSATRKEVFDFVRAYIDAHNRADATALSDAISRRLDVASINDGM